jgi:hypothetical protein
VTIRRLTLGIACALVIAVPPAAAHSRIPRAWWLDDKIAVDSLQDTLKSRYRPPVVQTFTGRCTGLVPRATRAGRAVYKHFACSARMRAKGVNFTFYYRIHVTGPRGRITIGG